MNPSNQQQAIKQMPSNGGLLTLRLGAPARQSGRKTAAPTKLGIFFEASSGVAKQLPVSVKTAKHFQGNFTKEKKQAKACQPSWVQLSAGGSPGIRAPRRACLGHAPVVEPCRRRNPTAARYRAIGPHAQSPGYLVGSSFEPIFRVQPGARLSEHLDGRVLFYAKAPMPVP